MSVYTLNGIKQGANNITGIIDQSISPNIETALMGGGGSVDPTVAALMSVKPLLSFTTTDIAAVLTLFDIGGTDAASLVMSFAVGEHAGTRAATYMNVTVYGGIVVPRILSADQGGNATLQCDVICTGDASNDPIAVAAGSVTHVPPTGALFTLGPVELETVDQKAVSINLDFGLQVLQEGNSGVNWDEFAYIVERLPDFSVTTKDFSLAAAAYPAVGAGITLTSFTFYLRKKSEGGGGNVVDGTAQHIKISGTTGVATIDSMSGSHGDTSTIVLNVRPSYDGANAILVFDLASAIT
jgi:hypothetical protein